MDKLDKLDKLDKVDKIDKVEEKKKTAVKDASPKKAAKTGKKQPQGDIIFALDIGTRSVVGVLAQKTAEGCKILDMETIVHKTRSMSDGQIEDIKSVIADVRYVKRTLEGRNGIALAKACVAAAGRTLKTMRATYEHKLPQSCQITDEIVKAAELEAVRRTCESFSEDNQNKAFYCVGHSVIARWLDGYKTATPEGHRGELITTEIIAAFLPVNVVESLCAVVEGAGMEVSGLTLEPIAAMNAVVPSDLRVINIALCDIGAGTADVAISDDGSISAYGMATIAGDEVTEQLMKTLLVDFVTAENIKTSSDKQVTYKNILAIEGKLTSEEIDEIIRPAVQQLAAAISQEILSANGKAPQAVFLVGGSSKLRELPELLSRELGMDKSRIVAGSRETLRGIIAPNSLALDGEHSTPIGIAISAGEGVSYDFTTITINGKKYRAPDTSRLTVFELLPIAKIKPENLIAGAGKSLSFTISGEKKILRGTPAKPSEIKVNGELASLNTNVKKGDEITVDIAQKGTDAVAKLSEYFDFSAIKSTTVTLLGNKLRAGCYLLVNDREITTDRRIQNDDVISLVSIKTLGELLKSQNTPSGEYLVNDEPRTPDYRLHSGDVITSASAKPEVKETVPPAPVAPVATVTPVAKPEAAPVEAEQTTAVLPSEITESKADEQPSDSDGITITVNDIKSVFPKRADGTLPIFLDVLAVFSDNPTELLKTADVVTINGKIARLDEVINDGDYIIIE